MTDRSAPFVRTVLGDVEPRALGAVNYHEHLFQTTPLLPGDEIDDEDLSRAEVESTHAAGIDSMVDATPWGLGRDPAAVARISHATGVHVVATSGFHREEHYRGRDDVQNLSTDEIAAQCLRELTHGQSETDEDPTGGGRTAVGPLGGPVRAGLLKAGIGYWSVTAFESCVLDGVATAHRATGAPVMIHLEHGSAAHEALDRLAAGGVSAERVVLAHIDRSPDPGLYAELASRGAYLGCDGAARLKDWPESTLIAAIANACEAGFGARILLGGDVARRSRYVAYGGMPGIAYLTERFAPRLASAVGAAAVRMFLADNPQRLLAWTGSAGERTDPVTPMPSGGTT